VHRQSLIVVAVLVVGAGLLHGNNMFGSPARFDDEGTYVSQAWAFQTHGTLAYYTYWYDHPPLGWMLLAAWNLITFAAPFHVSLWAADRVFMLVVDLVSCVLIFGTGRRYGFPRWAAALAVVVFTVSPIGLTWTRMVLLDNLATPLLLAAFFLAVSPARRLSAYSGSAVCLAAAVLVKETSILFVPFVFWQIWRSARPETRKYVMTLSGGLFFSGVLLYPLYAIVKGELIPGKGHVSLLGSLAWQFFGRPGNGGLLDVHSSKHQIVATLVHQDPWLLIGTAVLCPLAFLSRPIRPIAGATLVQVLLPFSHGYYPSPQVINLLWGASLVLGSVAAQLATWHPRRLPLRSGLVSLCALGVAFAALAGPHEASLDGTLLTANANSPRVQADLWISAHLSKTANVLVDNNFWLDMVEEGFDPARTVWFTKLDRDPAVEREFPGRWRDFQYVVSSDAIRATDTQYPDVLAAMTYSTVVATFGAGGDRVEIRRILPRLAPRLDAQRSGSRA